jgi:hypothetical protein
MTMIGCNEREPGFALEIKKYGGATGITIYYLVSDKSVQVDNNCELENCKRKTVYKRDLDKRQSDSVYFFIQSLYMDTLHEEYRPTGLVEDGQVTSINICGLGLPTKSVMLDNRNTPTTDALLNFVVGLVPEKFRHF